jgi:hypothetical protein
MNNKAIVKKAKHIVPMLMEIGQAILLVTVRNVQKATACAVNIDQSLNENFSYVTLRNRTLSMRTSNFDG